MSEGDGFYGPPNPSIKMAGVGSLFITVGIDFVLQYAQGSVPGPQTQGLDVDGKSRRLIDNVRTCKDASGTLSLAAVLGFSLLYGTSNLVFPPIQ